MQHPVTEKTTDASIAAVNEARPPITVPEAAAHTPEALLMPQQPTLPDPKPPTAEQALVPPVDAGAVQDVSAVVAPKQAHVVILESVRKMAEKTLADQIGTALKNDGAVWLQSGLKVEIHQGEHGEAVMVFHQPVPKEGADYASFTENPELLREAVRHVVYGGGERDKGASWLKSEDQNSATKITFHVPLHGKPYAILIQELAAGKVEHHVKHHANAHANAHADAAKVEPHDISHHPKPPHPIAGAHADTDARPPIKTEHGSATQPLHSVSDAAHEGLVAANSNRLDAGRGATA